MADLIVPTVRVTNIYPHPNADKLDFIEVAGWRCIVSRGSAKKGDWGAYFPIDSVLTPEIMHAAFKDAKVKPQNGRVKTVKIRGEIAQGLFLGQSLLPVFPKYPKEGQDLAEVLGIVKYEPALKDIPLYMRSGKKSTRKRFNTNFKEYMNIQHLKWFTNVFEPGEEIAVTEKVHGASGRFARVPPMVDTLWKRALKFFGKLPVSEFVYGSRKVQLQYKKHRTTSFYGTDIWGVCADKYNMEYILSPGEAVYGEIYGEGIQKGYAYGVPADDRRFAVYDVEKDGKFFSHDDLVTWCADKGLEMVPTLYVGPYSQEIIDGLTDGPSVLDPNTKVREGVVTRTRTEKHGHNGRAVYKSVSPEFLLGAQSDFH